MGLSFSGTQPTADGPSYPRALLAHQARWSTIRATIDRLLSDNVDKYSPGAVLDFLSVCQSHPYLYQGREKRKPKVNRQDAILCV